MPDADEQRSGPDPARTDRRAFLKAASWAAGALTFGAGGALVGCSDDPGAPGGASGATSTPPRSRTPRVPEHRPSANPYLAGNFAPVVEEVEATALTVRGHLPEAMHGRFMRNGPNPIAVPDPAHHSWFVGDGIIHTVELRGGVAVAYRNRYLRTTRAVAALGGPLAPGPAPLVFDGSNTNVVPFGREVLSVAEGSMPYVVDATGRTLRRIDFGGGLDHGLSAHAKYDAATGELHNVGYRITGAPWAVWQVIDRSGRIVRTVPIDIPRAGMWHTFSLTGRYVVLYDLPVVFTPERLEAGWVFPFAWDEHHQARVGLIERDGDGSVRWLDVPPCFANHDIAAHDTPSGVTVHLSVSRRIFDRDAAGPLETPPRLQRWDIDVPAGIVRQTTLDDRALEFPRAHPGAGLGAVRYVYGVGAGPGRSGGGVLEPGNAIIKHDLVRQRVEVGRLGATKATAEAVFVADPGRERDEDGGWLVSFVYDAAVDRSELAVTDAQDVQAGPIARVLLPQRVPFGFHGNWFPAA